MVMTKKSGLAKPTSASNEEKHRCGECLHFKNAKHRSHDDLCHAMGVKTFAIAPICFTPDYPTVLSNSDEFVQLAALLHDKTPRQRKILLAILRMQPQGRKLRLGTKMYLNVRSSEYVSNYVSAYVVGYSSAGEIVLMGSPNLTERGRAFYAYLKSDQTLLTPKEWVAKFQELRTKGRITDPKLKATRDITAQVKEDNYEPPTIDQAPDPDGKRRKASKEDREDKERRTSVVKLMQF